MTCSSTMQWRDSISHGMLFHYWDSYISPWQVNNIITDDKDKGISVDEDTYTWIFIVHATV